MTGKSRRAARSVVREVCAYYDVKERRLVSTCREPLLVEARRVIITILAEDVGLGPSEIARLVHRDHSTVLHHLGRTGWDVRWSPEAASALADVRAALSLERGGAM